VCDSSQQQTRVRQAGVHPHHTPAAHWCVVFHGTSITKQIEIGAINLGDGVAVFRNPGLQASSFKFVRRELSDSDHRNMTARFNPKLETQTLKDKL